VGAYPPDQRLRLDFRVPTQGTTHTEGDTLWVNYSTRRFQLKFNGFLKVAFQGSRVTSDAGLVLVRELDERLGLETLISEHLDDTRPGNRQWSDDRSFRSNLRVSPPRSRGLRAPRTARGLPAQNGLGLPPERHDDVDSL
jgi:hypothetical protein